MLLLRHYRSTVLRTFGILIGDFGANEYMAQLRKKELENAFSGWTSNKIS